jgi:hypothetical protein
MGCDVTDQLLIRFNYEESIVQYSHGIWGIHEISYAD